MRTVEWPSGGSWSVGGLTQSPSELSAQHGLTFERGADDLDEVELAWVVDSKIGPILLQRYCNSPDSGTEILVDFAVTRTASDRALRRFFAGSAFLYSWRTPFETAAETFADADAQTKAHRVTAASG